jgi:hypothetical protein
MSSNNDYDKNKVLQNGDQESGGDQTGTTGSGGQGGKIEFHDFLATGANVRDDLLSFEEKKHLIATHKDVHELKVKQQKEKRDQYKNLKEGKVTLKSFREGLMASGVNAQFKANPILARSAQFSGIDRQVNQLPTENLAETNQEKRDELLNELKYRLGYQPAPAFNPKPHGPGY